MNNKCSNFQTELKDGKSVIVFTTGTSMEPLLYDKGKKKATHVLVKPITEELSIGDMPMVLLRDGRYMIHRIIQIIKEQDDLYYITRGDNCVGSEKIKRDMVVGVVTIVYRKGKEIHITDKGYLRYVKVWGILYPIRKIWLIAKGILRSIKNKMGR